MSQLVITSALMQRIFASRLIVKQQNVGETRRFHIQGDGVTIPVTDKSGQQVYSSSDGVTPLTKTIYKVKANSHIAVLNERNREILASAIAAEQEDDTEAAHLAFNSYLNKVQVSFSVMNNPGRQSAKFYSGQLVEGEIVMITTDNGSLITIDNPRAVAVAKLDATPSFTLNDLLGISDKAPKAEDVLTPAESATEAAPVIAEAAPVIAGK